MGDDARVRRSFRDSRGQPPEPVSILATLIGWKVDGWLSAVVATIVLFLPSSLLLYGVARLWHRYRARDWHLALQNGLAPVGTGLVLPSVPPIGRVSGAGPLSWVIAGGSAIILGTRPTVHLLLLLAAGAVIFLVA